MNILKSELVKHEIKMKDFASNIGITPTHLTRICKSENLPRKELMIKISTSLGKTVQELFFSEEK